MATEIHPPSPNNVVVIAPPSAAVRHAAFTIFTAPLHQFREDCDIALKFLAEMGIPFNRVDADVLPRRFAAAEEHRLQITGFSDHECPMVFRADGACVGAGIEELRRAVAREVDIRGAALGSCSAASEAPPPPFLSALTAEETLVVDSATDAHGRESHHLLLFDECTPSPIRRSRLLERTFEIPNTHGRRMSYTDLFALLHGPNGVQIKRRGVFWRHPRAFVACDLVAVLLLRVCGRGSYINDAVPLCKQLHQRHMITPVRPSETASFEWNNDLWRFTADHGTPSLNSDRRFESGDREDSSAEESKDKDNTGRRAADVAAELGLWLSLLVQECRAPDGSVAYESLRRMDAFTGFTLATTELQVVDLTELNRAERTSFAINIFNTGVVHAYAVRGVPKTRKQCEGLLNSAGYDVGGRFYSLNDIKNGLLRCNRKPPGPWSSPPFSRDDPRLDCAVWNPDYRALFALSLQLAVGCGDGLPGVVYSTMNNLLDQQLQEAANAFVTATTSIDSERQALVVSHVFIDCEEDFQNMSVVATCLRHLPVRTTAECLALGVNNFTVEYAPLPTFKVASTT